MIPFVELSSIKDLFETKPCGIQLTLLYELYFIYETSIWWFVKAWLLQFRFRQLCWSHLRLTISNLLLSPAVSGFSKQRWAVAFWSSCLASSVSHPDRTSRRSVRGLRGGPTSRALPQNGAEFALYLDRNRHEMRQPECCRQCASAWAEYKRGVWSDAGATGSIRMTRFGQNYKTEDECERTRPLIWRTLWILPNSRSYSYKFLTNFGHSYKSLIKFGHSYMLLT